MGIILFFVLEKFFLWHHCHDIDCHQNSKHIVTLSLIGDTIHNFIDGALIAASFNLNHLIGFSTALAVIFHEIPQEIGDFGILIHHGISLKKTVIYNFVTALTSLLGVLVIFLINYDFSAYLLPVTAGGFIYLALTDLTPELHRHDPKISIAVTQLLCILLGIALMFCLIFLE